MHIESIFSTLNISDRAITDEQYFKLSTKDKSDYVLFLIKRFRENLTEYLKYLEIQFKKNSISLKNIYEIEGEFLVWCEKVYIIFSKFIKFEKIHEVFFYGFDQDKLLLKYNSSMENTEVPKDKLMEYLDRIREYLKIPPLNSRTQNTLKMAPWEIIDCDTDEEESKESTDNIISEGSAIIGGEEIKLPYPFYTVAKYLEMKKAFTEEKAISQNDIHLELNLPFSTPRIKQWKKIKGKPNPLISKVFEVNTRGLVWLKMNIKVF